MVTRIGIPRALLYYRYYPMWMTFLKEMGAEVIVSRPGNASTTKQGASRVVSDTCLPVKTFIGHVISLSGQCDYIFIPVLRSTRRKVLNCSRFLGLPDVARAVVPEAPPILDIELDVDRGKRYLYSQIYKLGSRFSANPLKVSGAAKKAWQEYLNQQELMSAKNLTYNESNDLLQDLVNKEKEDSPFLHNGEKPVVLGLVGHPYILCDEQTNHRLLKRLNDMNVIFQTPEMLTTEQKRNGVKSITRDTYWVSEEEVIGAGGYFIQKGVDGIIGAMAFSCGPDSLMMHLVSEKAREAGIPFMSLTFEEHTAEAGVVTRLEAFLDMVRRRSGERKDKCA